MKHSKHIHYFLELNKTLHKTDNEETFNDL